MRLKVYFMQEKNSEAHVDFLWRERLVRLEESSQALGCPHRH
jgi:hypothetical protein